MIFIILDRSNAKQKDVNHCGIKYVQFQIEKDWNEIFKGEFLIGGD